VEDAVTEAELDKTRTVVTELNGQIEGLKKKNQKLIDFIEELEDNEKWLSSKLKKASIDYDIDQDFKSLSLDIELFKPPVEKRPRVSSFYSERPASRSVFARTNNNSGSGGDPKKSTNLS